MADGFAEGLFRGGRVLRGTLFVVAAGTFAAFVTLPPEETATAAAVRIGLEVVLGLLALAMLAPRRFHWAGRALCGLAFLTYLAYFVDELVAPSGPAIGGRRSDSSLGNAVLGTVIIGWPALVYALRPRRGRRPFTLRFVAPAPVEPGDGRAIVERLADRLRAAGWSVEGPHDEGRGIQEAWGFALERDGTRSLLVAEVEHLPEHDPEQDDEPDEEDDALASWSLWLQRDEPVDWEEDALAALLGEACQELAASAEAAA